MTRVLLIDDHASYREALAFMLAQDPNVEDIAQAGSLAEARSNLTGVDIAVVDLALPDGSGVNVIWDLLANNPGTTVLVLTASTDRREFARSVEAGATGILSKSQPIREILQAIRRAAEGAVLLSPHDTIELLRMASQQRQQEHLADQLVACLTRREVEVLSALGQGFNDREIGEKLSISTETVRTHFVNIHSKLRVSSRIQALIFAIRHGLITIG